MNKHILLGIVFLFAGISSFSQVLSIRPDSALQGQVLTTTITVAVGTFQTSTPPLQNTDIYLQQGATIINCFPNFGIYGFPPFYADSVWADFTIPANAPAGYYDVHVIVYDWQFNAINMVLPNGFHIGYFAGTIEGDLYFDSNQNGGWDGGEPPLMNHRVQIAPGNHTVYSNAVGHYKAYLDSNTYTATYLSNVSFTQTSVPLTYSGTVPPSYTGWDFGAYSAQQLYNQYFYVWHHPMRCQPSLGYTYVNITNNGYLTVQGSITMVHSPNLSLNTAVPAPDVISGDTLTWYYSSLQPGQSIHIGGANGMNWLAFNDPPAGDTIWYTTVDSVFDMGGMALTQYADSFAFVVTCSCDPNDKWASPFGVSSQHYTPTNSDLRYTINFQNTGNDTAFTVIIKDTLDANLDWNTFEVISSTHPVFAEMDVNGVVTFTFDNIYLPDSNVNEPASHGAVAYAIRPDSLLPDPTVINNTSYIYFDANPAVVTNTTLNTMTDLQYPSASFTATDLSVCPGYCIDFTGSLNPGSAFQWSFPGGTPSSSTDTDPSNICYNSSGTYDVQLIVSNALGADTATYSSYIEVFTVAAQAITQSGDSLIANTGFVNYVWYYNGNVIPGATDYFYLATQNGDYNVISFDANGCDVEAVAYNVMVGIGGINIHHGFRIFPNPVHDFMTIQGIQSPDIKICNVLGEIVLSLNQEQGTNASNVIRLDLSNLQPGLYSIEFMSGHRIVRSPFVKQ